MFTKKELELQKSETLDQFKNRVIAEAKRRLNEKGYTSLCTNALRNIRRPEKFIDHVEEMVNDTMHYDNPTTKPKFGVDRRLKKKG